MKSVIISIFLFTILMVPKSTFAEGYPNGDEAFHLFAVEHWSALILDQIPARPYRYRNVLRVPRTDDDGSQVLDVTMVISYRLCVPEEKMPRALRGKFGCIPVPQSKLPEMLRGKVLNDRIEVSYRKTLEGWLPYDMSTLFVKDHDPYHTITRDIPIVEDTNKPPVETKVPD